MGLPRYIIFCDEIQEFHVLELRIETNVYVPGSSFVLLSSSEKVGLNGNSNPNLYDADAVVYQLHCVATTAVVLHNGKEHSIYSNSTL